MKTISLSLITVLFSLFAWADEPEVTSHPTDASAPAAATYEEPAVSGSTTATESSSYSQEESSLSGSGTGFTDANEVPAESPRLSGASMSGASTTVPYGNAMHDQNKALEMCRSLNPDRSCVDVVNSCRGQANLESCMQRNAQ